MRDVNFFSQERPNRGGYFGHTQRTFVCLKKIKKLLFYFFLNTCYHIKSWKHLMEKFCEILFFHLPYFEQNILFFKIQALSFSHFLILVIKTDLQKASSVNFRFK